VSTRGRHPHRILFGLQADLSGQATTLPDWFGAGIRGSSDATGTDAAAEPTGVRSVGLSLQPVSAPETPVASLLDNSGLPSLFVYTASPDQIADLAEHAAGPAGEPAGTSQADALRLPVGSTAPGTATMPENESPTAAGAVESPSAQPERGMAGGGALRIAAGPTQEGDSGCPMAGACNVNTHERLKKGRGKTKEAIRSAAEPCHAGRRSKRKAPDADKGPAKRFKTRSGTVETSSEPAREEPCASGADVASRASAKKQGSAKTPSAMSGAKKSKKTGCTKCRWSRNGCRTCRGVRPPHLQFITKM
jgi:hypothetical protein